jgi:hypothetical protein
MYHFLSVFTQASQNFLSNQQFLKHVNQIRRIRRMRQRPLWAVENIGMNIGCVAPYCRLMGDRYGTSASL